MSECILQAENLSKHWGGLKALNEFNIKFYDKSLHSIVGPNGAGKSTMLNILCGTYSATKGVILYRGENITGLKSHQFCRKGIGRSFQKTNIFKDATCLENCCIAAQQRVGSSFNMFKSKHSSKHVTAIAEDALEQVGLLKQANTKASAISYGEQRQLEIAMVLATDPQVLLLDEPTANLDPYSLNLIEDLVLEENSIGKTIIFTTHDMSQAKRLATDVIFLNKGKVLEQTNPLNLNKNR